MNEKRITYPFHRSRRRSDMKWHSSKISGNHGSSWLKPILPFLLLLCFLVAFNLSFADGPLDSNPQNLEHPWDDSPHAEFHRSSTASTGTYDPVMLPLGVGLRIIVHVQPVTQKEDGGAGKVFAPSEKNRGNLFIFIR
jgi:hypothetical protein